MTEDQLIDEAASTISDHDIHTGIFYEPFRKVWSEAYEIGTNRTVELTQLFKQAILDQLNFAWDISDRQINSFRQENNKKSNVESVLNKHWHHYSGLVEKYQPFEYWYDELWSFPNKPDTAKLIDGLWNNLFFLCQERNLPFEVGLLIIREVFSNNLTLAKLNIIQSETFVTLIQKQEKAKNEIIYKSFADLFLNRVDIDLCVNALRKYRPEKPILGEGLNWTGSTKDKGVIVAWIERMESMRQPKIHRLSNRKQLVGLLNRFFTKLNMGEHASVFNNPVDVEDRDIFIALLPE